MHYGPGGNAAFERACLESLQDKIDFWDQPILSGEAATFQNLVDACVARFDSRPYVGIIGHSFGCNIAEYMVGRTEKPIAELILLSPIRDLPLGFAVFAERIGKIEPARDLKSAIALRSSTQSSADEIKKFWTVIQAIMSNPDFYQAYWGSEKVLAKFAPIFLTVPQLDASMWQVGLSDFFSRTKTRPELSGIRKKSVFLGGRDPYYSAVQDEKKFWEQQGYTATVFPDCGHYTHIEASALKK